MREELSIPGVAFTTTSRKMQPREKQGESIMEGIIQEALTIILVDTKYILRKKELSDLGRGRLKIIKNQVDSIRKALAGR